MIRTVPESGSEDIALYIRTYYSLLRGSREVKIKTLAEAHTRMGSALHVYADEGQLDTSAFIYAIMRLPKQIVSEVRHVVMGQSEWSFREYGYGDVDGWERVFTPARRRKTLYDGAQTLAVFIASRSDLDDLIPMLTAFQIERDKFHALLQGAAFDWLHKIKTDGLDQEELAQLAEMTGVSLDDWVKLQKVWGDAFLDNLRAIARERVSLTVRSLSGSLADYRRATRQWWEAVEEALPEIEFADRPIYFVSSNTHSLLNMVSGFALKNEKEIVGFIREEGSAELQNEYDNILSSNVPSNRQNFLYYVQKKYESRYPEVVEKRLLAERSQGIYRVPSDHLFDIEVDIFDLSKLDPDVIDPRLCLPEIELLSKSNALIVNIDFPLGMAAYQVLSEITRNIASIRGVYIMGKAATLNGRIGDVMIPTVVHDEHSKNTFLFKNVISAESVTNHLVYGNILDNQKAITVLGTFLQNQTHMSVFYSEGYTDMEMEAGPYLNSIYEMIRPKRYPSNEIIHFHDLPFPLGIIHYASDTPMSKGKNLGEQNLSYFGVDATYASSIAILSAIIKQEIQNQKLAT